MLPKHLEAISAQAHFFILPKVARGPGGVTYNYARRPIFAVDTTRVAITLSRYVGDSQGVDFPVVYVAVDLEGPRVLGERLIPRANEYNKAMKWSGFPSVDRRGSRIMAHKSRAPIFKQSTAKANRSTAQVRALLA